MFLALPIALGLVLGLAARGDPRRLAGLRLRHIELFYLAVGLQILAFPFPFLPWQTSDAAARALWLGSYAILFCGAFANRTITGVPVIAAGMASNVIAVVANGGHMPALPQALHAAHKNYVVHFNSAASATPRLPWLVDRWAVPRWVHVGNVYSVGDVVIAVGAVVLIVAAMGVTLPVVSGARGRAGRARGGHIAAPESPLPSLTSRPGAAGVAAGVRLAPTFVVDPISPELALVPPELAERCRAELPDRPWETFLPAAPVSATGAPHSSERLLEKRRSSQVADGARIFRAHRRPIELERTREGRTASLGTRTAVLTR